MYILGDIGNTETKICLVSKKNKILKKIIFSSKSVNYKKLNNLLKQNKIKLNKVLINNFEKSNLNGKIQIHCVN